MEKKIIIIGAGHISEMSPHHLALIEKYQELHPGCEVATMTKAEFLALSKSAKGEGNFALIGIEAQIHAMDFEKMQKDLNKEIDRMSCAYHAEERIEHRFQQEQNRFRSQHHSRNFRRKR